MLFWALILVSHACYTDIDQPLECDAPTFTFSGEDFFCYLATHDFTSAEEIAVIQLPEGRIEVSASECGGEELIENPHSGNEKLKAEVLHIKGAESTELVLKTNFAIGVDKRRLILENLNIKLEKEDSLDQSLAGSGELWLKDVKFEDLKVSSKAVFFQVVPKFRNVTFQNVDSGWLFSYFSGQVDISGLSIKNSSFSDKFARIDSWWAPIDFSNVSISNSNFKKFIETSVDLKFSYATFNSFEVKSSYFSECFVNLSGGESASFNSFEVKSSYFSGIFVNLSGGESTSFSSFEVESSIFVSDFIKVNDANTLFNSFEVKSSYFSECFVNLSGGESASVQKITLDEISQGTDVFFSFEEVDEITLDTLLIASFTIEECSSFIQVKHFSALEIKALEINGHSCEGEYNTKSPILDVESGSNVSIANSQFQNMNSVSYVGYAMRIFTVQYLYVSNATFENVSNQRESIIELRTVASLSFSDLEFKDCTGGSKGIFFANVGQLELARVKCSSCGSQNGNGGVIYYIPYTNSYFKNKLSIKDSTFQESTAQLGQGGAIFLNSNSKSDQVELLVQNTQFKNSKAARGSVIYIGETVSLTSGVLNGVEISGSYTEMGAPINDHHSSGKLQIINSTISDSSGYYCGIYGEYAKQGELLNIADSHFSNANCQDSLIRLNSWVQNVSAVLNNCSVSNVGYSVLVQNTKLSIVDSKFYKYTQKTFEEIQSKLSQTDYYKQYSEQATTTILSQNSELEIIRSEFKNQIGDYGGSIKLESSSAVIRNSVFEKGVSLEEAGAIYLTRSSLEVYDTEFKDLSSAAGGVFSGTLSSEITAGNCTFSKVFASRFGGVAFMNSGSIKVLDSKVSHSSGTALLLNNCEDFELQSSEFKHCEGGALKLSDLTRIHIENSTFLNGSTTKDAGAVFIRNSQESDVVFTIKDSTFSSNLAARGGALYSDNSVLNITNSAFYNNSATEEGGAVFLEYTGFNYNSSSISNCSFIKNSAASNGGSIRWQNVKPQLNSILYQNNSASYGADVASYAVTIAPTAQQRRLSGVPVIQYIQGIVPGQKVQSPIELSLQDQYGNIVTTDNSSKAGIRSSEATISGTNAVIAQKGVFLFDDFALIASPNQNVTVQFYANSIEEMQKTVKDQETNFNPIVSVLVYLRDCEAGEYNTGTECQLCESGTYSLSPDQPCKPCLDEAECLGNWTIFPKPGYWRVSENTGKFYKCPNPDACLGSPDYSEFSGVCEEGYRGNMCQACKSGYSRISENTCAPCPDPAANFSRLLGILVLVLVVSVVLVMSTLKSAYKPKSLYSIYIKIFTNYIQLVYLTTQFNLAWPKIVLDMFSVQKSTATATEQVFSVDCYMGSDEEDEENTGVYFQKIVIMSFLPAVMWVISAGVWGGIAYFRNSLILLKRELVATMIVLFFLVHPTLVKVMFSVFACREIEGQGYWLVENLDIKCWDNTHTFYALAVALPSILVWGVGTPSVMLYAVYKKRRYLFKEDNKLRFGFLFNGYKTSKFYWEFVVLYRKIAVICLAVFFSTISVQIQALTCLLVLIVSLYSQVQLKPFISKQLNQLENSAVFTATITIYCGIYYLTGDLDEYSKVLFFVMMLGCNLYFLGFWLKCMLKSVVEAFINAIPALKSRFRKSDGLDPNMYNEEKAIKSGYLQEDKMIYTLIKPKPKPPEDNLDEFNSMLDVYRECFKQIVEDDGLEPIQEEI